jgi:hypothetical protein
VVDEACHIALVTEIHGFSSRRVYMRERERAGERERERERKKEGRFARVEKSD